MNFSDLVLFDMIYFLDLKFFFMEVMFVVIQYVLVSFVGIIIFILIIGGVFGLGEYIFYLISMLLMVFGVGIFIQVRRFVGIGVGMICVQGISFVFLGIILVVGFIVKGQGGGLDEMLFLIFGVCFLGVFIEMFLSQFMYKLSKVIMSLVIGIVIIIIGISLIKVGMMDLVGGFNVIDFGFWQNLFLGLFVLVLIIVLNQFCNQWI